MNYEIIINHWTENQGYTHNETIANKETLEEAIAEAKFWNDETGEEIEVKNDDGETVYSIEMK